MVSAAVAGAVDFSTCDGSRRWWAGARLRMQLHTHQLSTKASEVDTIRASLIQTMLDLGQTASDRQDFAIQAVQRYRAQLMPWLPAPKAQNQTSDPLSAIALWYLRFAPELVS